MWTGSAPQSALSLPGPEDALAADPGVPQRDRPARPAGSRAVAARPAGGGDGNRVRGRWQSGPLLRDPARAIAALRAARAPGAAVAQLRLFCRHPCRAATGQRSVFCRAGGRPAGAARVGAAHARSPVARRLRCGHRRAADAPRAADHALAGADFLVALPALRAARNPPGRGGCVCLQPGLQGQLAATARAP